MMQNVVDEGTGRPPPRSACRSRARPGPPRSGRPDLHRLVHRLRTRRASQDRRGGRRRAHAGVRRADRGAHRSRRDQGLPRAKRGTVGFVDDTPSSTSSSTTVTGSSAGSARAGWPTSTWPPTSRSGRQVAIKILSDRYARDDGFVERFRREASAAAGLNHPNIVAVYDRGEAEGTYYIAMEFLDGPDAEAGDHAARAAAGGRRRSAGPRRRWTRSTSPTARVIHRDVKPHNMVLTDDGRLKVTDFGIARAQNTQEMTEVGSIVGTAQYLSPEQARGQAVGPSPTSTRWASCCSRCSRASCPSPATGRSTSP